MEILQGILAAIFYACALVVALVWRLLSYAIVAVLAWYLGAAYG